MSKKVSKQLVSIIEAIIGELKKKKTSKRVASSPPGEGLGVSKPLAMKRQTNSTRIRELKDRIRIQKLEKELQKRDFVESNQQAREALRNFLNTRELYEDDGYDGPIIEEIDADIPPYRMPPEQRGPGFSMSDAFGAFGQTSGSDRFLTQRAPFQTSTRSMERSLPPLELVSTPAAFESVAQQERQPLSYIDEQEDIFGGGGEEEGYDFGVDPYAQADAATPFFDAAEGPTPEAVDIELPQVIGGRPRVSRRSERISQLRAQYRDLAGTDLDPNLYRSTKIRELEPPIRDMLLRNYLSLGGANPQVLKSKKIGLIENEIKNLKQALNI